MIAYLFTLRFDLKVWSFRNSQFQDEYTLDQILDSKTVHEPLTKLQCCPTSDGSAAAIVASEEFVKSRGLQDHVIQFKFCENVNITNDTFTK